MCGEKGRARSEGLIKASHLTISEDAGVVAVQDADNERGHLGVHGFLPGLQPEHLFFAREVKWRQRQRDREIGGEGGGEL